MVATDQFWLKFWLCGTRPRPILGHNFWTSWDTDLYHPPKFSIFYALSLCPQTFFCKIDIFHKKWQNTTFLFNFWWKTLKKHFLWKWSNLEWNIKPWSPLKSDLNESYSYMFLSKINILAATGQFWLRGTRPRPIPTHCQQVEILH